VKRSEIEKTFRTLTELKEMESFLNNQKGEEGKQWCYVKTPQNQYDFLNGDIRDLFLVFVETQIEDICKTLNLDT
jgi:hypothetical protein